MTALSCSWGVRLVSILMRLDVEQLVALLVGLRPSARAWWVPAAMTVLVRLGMSRRGTMEANYEFGLRIRRLVLRMVVIDLG